MYGDFATDYVAGTVLGSNFLPASLGAERWFLGTPDESEDAAEEGLGQFTPDRPRL